MASAKRLARRARRKAEFLAREGSLAVRHDPRTWASRNGGEPLSRADLGYLRKFPYAHNVESARMIAHLEKLEQA